MSMPDQLLSTLNRHGYRVTAARKEVYSVLARTDRPLSNAEIIRGVTGTDRVSVYRTLDLYEALGVTHRIWDGFKSKVELSGPFSPHHHHFTCATCGSVMSFKSTRIERALKDLESSIGITIQNHLVELSGQCQDCKEQR